MSKVTRFGVLEIFVAFLITVLCLWYVYLNPAYDISTLLIGVAIPAVLGSALLVIGKQRVLLFVFLAYFWSLVDDAPAYFDSVFTWPEVTRYHPATPHLFLEVLYHLLTAVFLVLAVREAARGAPGSASRTIGVFLLTTSAFVLAYAQNIPLNVIQVMVEDEWYQLDVVEHILSVFVLFLAIAWIRGRSPSSGLCS